MSNDIHNTDEVFYNLSEETFNALVKFMRLSPDEREQVIHFACDLSTDK